MTSPSIDTVTGAASGPFSKVVCTTCPSLALSSFAALGDRLLAANWKPDVRVTVRSLLFLFSSTDFTTPL